MAANLQAEKSEPKPTAETVDPKYKGLPIVFVDVRYILDHHTPLKAQLDNWGRELQKLEDRQREERRKIQTLNDNLKDLSLGSSDHSRLELEIAEREEKFNGTYEVQYNQLLRQRANLFLEAYGGIRKGVDQFLKDHEIGAALTFDGNFRPCDPISIRKPRKYVKVDEGRLRFGSGDWTTGSGERYVVDEVRSLPEKVEELITRPTLSVNPDRDITPLILRRINNAAAKEKAAAEKAKKAMDTTANAEKPKVK